MKLSESLTLFSKNNLLSKSLQEEEEDLQNKNMPFDM